MKRDKWALFVVDYSNEIFPGWKSFAGACSWVDPVTIPLLNSEPKPWGSYGQVYYGVFKTRKEHFLEYLDWGVHPYAKRNL